MVSLCHPGWLGTGLRITASPPVLVFHALGSWSHATTPDLKLLSRTFKNTTVVGGPGRFKTLYFWKLTTVK